MAEFCLACFNSINHTNYIERDVTLEDDYCEGCGVWKPCIVRLQPPGILSRIIKRITQHTATGKEQPKIVKRRNGAFKVERHGSLLTVESLPLDIQAAYIRLFGAAGAALDELAKLQPIDRTPEVQTAYEILQEAVEYTDGKVNLSDE